MIRASADTARALAISFAALALSAAMLMSPAVWNGSPLYYWDSVDYVYLPFTWDLQVYRTVSYGVFAGSGRIVGSLWGVVVVQALVAAYVLRETLVVFWPGRPDRALLPLTAVLTVCTGLPWAVSQLMPDAFTGLMVLGLAALLADAGRLGRRRWLLLVLTAIATAVHTSHIAIGAGLVVAFLVLAPFARRRWPSLRLRVALPALTVGTAIAMVIGAHWVTIGKLQLTQPTAVLMLARLVQDGIAKQYLDRHCAGDRPYMLCRFKDRLPATANAFLWEHNSIVQQLGGWQKLKPEAEEILARTLREYPWTHLGVAMRLTFEQVTRLHTGEGLVPDLAWLIRDPLKKYYPDDHAAFVASRQMSGIDFATINALHLPLQAGMVFLLLAFGVRAWRRDDGRAVCLATATALSLFGNALVCGALSNPADRYQSRLVWLAFVGVAVAACPAGAAAQTRARRQRNIRATAISE